VGGGRGGGGGGGVGSTRAGRRRRDEGRMRGETNCVARKKSWRSRASVSRVSRRSGSHDDALRRGASLAEGLGRRGGVRGVHFAVLVDVKSLGALRFSCEGVGWGGFVGGFIYRRRLLTNLPGREKKLGSVRNVFRAFASFRSGVRAASWLGEPRAAPSPLGEPFAGYARAFSTAPETAEVTAETAPLAESATVPATDDTASPAACANFCASSVTAPAVPETPPAAASAAASASSFALSFALPRAIANARGVGAEGERARAPGRARGCALASGKSRRGTHGAGGRARGRDEPTLPRTPRAGSVHRTRRRHAAVGEGGGRVSPRARAPACARRFQKNPSVVVRHIFR